MAKDEEKKSKKRKSEVGVVEGSAAPETTPAKKSKKDKSKSTGDESAMDIDTASPEKKESKGEKEEYFVPPEAIAPIAHPLAGKKLGKKLFKGVKKASKARQLKRGVKEVVKAIRKKEKGILLLASNITPIDILSHLPVLAEEASLPFVWVTSKEELGAASGTKRATSCVLICEETRKKKAGADEKTVAAEAEKQKEFKESYDELKKEVGSLDHKIVF